MKVLKHIALCSLLFASTACLKQEGGQKIPGINGPDLNVQNGKVLLSIEMENVQTQAGITMPISEKMKNSTVTIGPAMRSDGTFGGTLVRVALDPEDVNSEDFRLVPPQTLPDGREFPYLVEGTLPSLAFQVPKAKNSTFYVSEKVFGLFLPIKLPDGFFGSIHYKLIVNGKSYGVVSLIHPDANGEGAGVLALLTMKEIQSSKGLQKLMRISKKNKSVIY